MQIKSDISSKNIVISLIGRLDTITSPQLEEEINSFSLENIETVILDLKELEYISSAGLRVVLMIHKKMNKLGGQLKLINVNDMILNIFDMTGMSEFLNIQKE
ncbi:MAG: STAS domain-containing protein [Ruminococcus bromii]|nr:STAS domain-containing protein [Ruminococcus bromii]MCI7211741.1 STAS domain-containing protein [Ruminococcus bromii]MDD6434278.1 STAS domain-containing protein [Ruminococcus bromii]MDY4084529.1 STAS domain-containing protein [Ruminococcus bromii]MDY4711181.1 STAS domain-containing protein [Ruminococcus bromii]